MTQFSMLPWTTGGAGDGATPYTQDQSNNFFRYFDVRDPASEGVALGVLSELAVSGSSSPLTVAPGAAICYGRYWSDANVSLSVSTPGVGTTGGRVVLRCTWSTRQIRLAVKMSASGIATPPALTQSFGSTWEISLATFTITTGGTITLTDDRAFRKATFQVDMAALANSAVSTEKITNGAVTNDKLAADSVTTAKIDDNAVTADKVADDSINDTKVGERVPQIYRRQGGHATNWASPGTTTHIPGNVRIAVGVLSVTVTTGNQHANGLVTFPFAFGTTPLIQLTCIGVAYAAVTTPHSYAGFGFQLYAPAVVLSDAVYQVQWMAIGTE